MIEMILIGLAVYIVGSLLLGLVVGVIRPFLAMSRAFDQARRQDED